MKVIKGLITGILCFLLFLSLSVFSTAFLLNSTLLNPDFVSSQVEKIDVSDIVRDMAEEQIAGNLPENLSFLKDAIYDVIDDQEPWLKEQSNKAIYATYDFFLGKTDKFEISIEMEGLKVSLRESLWETFNEQLPVLLPNLIKSELGSNISESLPELAGLPEEQAQAYIDKYLQEFAEKGTDGLPPEISGLMDTMIEPYFDQFYNELAEQIPSELTVDESLIPADVMEYLFMAREYIGYFQTGYYLLIAFMVLLVLAVFLVNRNVKDTTRALGIDLLIYGILELATILFARSYVPAHLPLDEIPTTFHPLVLGFYHDLLSPLLILSIIILVIGVALTTVSIIYKPRTAEV